MSHAAMRCRRSRASGDSRYVIRSESIRLIVFSSRTRHGYQRKPSASTMSDEESQPWSHGIRLKYPSGEMITPGYFFFISSPTRDMDHRSGRWSFVFFRWTAHMTTALTPASWHRRIFSSSAPTSFFVTTIWTVTMEPHFVYSSSSSYMSRFLCPSSIEMCRKSMYFPYSAIGYRCCMSLSDVVKRRYHGFWYWYFKSSSMSSRTSGSPPSKLQTITDERARLSRTAFTSSVGMSVQRFLTCQQLQNEQVKLQRRVSLKEQ